MIKYILFIIVVFVISFNGRTQSKDDILQQRIEILAEQLENEEVDLTAVLEQLSYYYDHPLNLNFATSDELENLGLLNEFQIKNLLLHLELNGKLISVFELQSLEYWDLTIIQILLPFVKVEDKLDQVHVKLKDVIKYGDFETFVRYQSLVQNKKGYFSVPDSVKMKSSAYYLGNKGHYYSRIRYSYRTNFSVGITAEKDPGEQFFRGSQSKGFDFYSFHAFYKGGKYLKSIAIGDYQIQIGQGLNLWSGYAFGKTADVTNVKKTATPIRPYTSVDETRFLRGGAIELEYKKIALTTFVSSKKIDATSIVDTSSNQFDFISSIQMTGLHRTSAEIQRKNGLTEKIIGANLKYRSRRFQCGVASIYQGYNFEYIKEIQPYNQFDFRGKEFCSVSGDYNWVLQNFNFFGEISTVSFSGAISQLHGVLIALDSYSSFSLLYRNYSKAYQTFYNNGFSEGSTTQNEKGLYLGLKNKISNSFMFNTYFDFFTFPWLKYQVNSPSNGYEFLAQLTYKPSKELEIYGRYREQRREKNSRNSDGTIIDVENVIQRNFRFNLSYSVSESIILKSRIEIVKINRRSNSPETGSLIFQEIQFKPKTLPFDVTIRYSLFQTDSYDSRIYAYESNALNVFSIPANYYVGSRVYCMIRYSFFRKFDVWVKYGVNTYNNRNTIGTGSEEIKENQKSEITIQFRMKI